MTGEIQLERRDDGVATLWIHNPAHRNTLNNALIESMTAHLIELGADHACRAIVLRGRGGIFCAGRELRDLRELQSADMATITATYDQLRRLNEALYFCPVPTIAAIEKYAFGAGITVVSWCDIAIAEADVLMAYPEVHHGIAPSPALMALIRGVTRKWATELWLTGRRVGAEEAARIGLITRAVPTGSLEAAVEEVLDGIKRGGPETIRRTKEFLWHAEDAGHRAAMASAVDSISISITTPEARQRIADFLDRRKR